MSHRLIIQDTYLTDQPTGPGKPWTAVLWVREDVVKGRRTIRRGRTFILSLEAPSRATLRRLIGRMASGERVDVVPERSFRKGGAP